MFKGASEEAAIKGGHRGRLWHRLRSDVHPSLTEVDGIPVIRCWIPCHARLRLVDAITQWGRPAENACPTCWDGVL